MIIFVNDDRGYLYWVTHHRQGFVLDGKRKPKVGHLVVYRSTSREIKSASSRRVHWTTGGKLKACCLDRAQLETWAGEETGAAAEYCPTCEPRSDGASSEESPIHLSKLSGDILEYVLEAALIHFEVEQPPYRLTLADIAVCFGKTPGQISPALHRLLAAGLLAINSVSATCAAIRPKCMVLPRASAIRTLEAFRNASDLEIQDELAKLEPG